MVGFYHFLAFTEYTLFKCCLVYLWSLAASLDHDFVAAFLQIFNIFFCTVLILSSMMLGYAHGSSTYVPLSGLQVLELVDNTPWNILMIVLLVINVTGFLSIRIKKWIERGSSLQSKQLQQQILQHQPDLCRPGHLLHGCQHLGGIDSPDHYVLHRGGSNEHLHFPVEGDLLAHNRIFDHSLHVLQLQEGVQIFCQRQFIPLKGFEGLMFFSCVKRQL